MKRITSIILATVMMLTMFPVYGSEAETISYESSIEVVKALGFMNGYPDGTFHSEGNVTRAEFACIVAGLLNMSPDITKGGATKFSDVTQSHWANTYVNIVSGMGLMSGYGNGKFLPENSITVIEAAKVLISLMGYDYFAQSNGGWPTGYVLQANSLDLLDDINSDFNAPITRGEMAQLLCASFDVDIYSPDGYGADVSIRKDAGVTILSKYHDIYDVEGIVTANNFTSVNGESKADNKAIAIDGERYYTECDATAFLGYNIKAYYREDDTNTRTILWMEKVNNDEISISPESIDEVGNYKLKYFDEQGKSRSFEISSNTNIVWNNEFDCRAVNFDFDTLSAVNGTITFINNDNDKAYDVIIVKDYTVGVVDSVNTINERISFKWDTDGLSLEDVTYTITRGGEKIAISEVNTSDVLSIAASNSFISGNENGVVEIIVSEKTAIGSVVATNDNKVTIETKDGRKVYEVSSEYISEKGNNIAIGDKGIFYLDVNDKVISCLPDTSGSMRFGYMIDAKLNESLVTNVLVKMLTASGTVEVYELKEKVRLDGEPVSAKEAYEALDDLSLEEQITMMVRYSLTADGLVSAIDTELRNSDNDPDELKISNVNIDQGMRYQSMGMTLVSYYQSDRYVLDQNLIVFSIPEAGSDDDEYMVYDNSYFRNEKYYGDVSQGQNMSVVNVKDGIPAAIIVKAGEALTNLGKIQLSEGPTSLIKGKVTALDDDGDVCIKLILDTKGTESELFITDKTTLLFGDQTNNVSNKLPGCDEVITIDDFNFGDVVMVDRGIENRANVLLRINGAKVSELEHGEYKVSGMSGYEEFIMGSVRKKNGTVLELDVSSDPNLLINAYRNPYVAVVEERSQTVTTGSLGEILASDSDFEADKIFARVRFGNVSEIYIYR